MLRLLPLLLALTAYAQVRIIPHVTRADGSFSSRVMIINQTNEPRGYRVTAYDESGVRLGTLLGSLDPYASREEDAASFFNGLTPSHFTIDSAEDISFFIVYEAAAGGGSPAHVVEQTSQGVVWRIAAGNWAEVYDAIAAVNTGDAATEVVLRQVSESGEVLASWSLGTVSPMAKTLAVTSQLFPAMMGGYYEVAADQPLAVTALRGDAASRFFWQSPAIPADLRIFPEGTLVSLQITPENPEVEIGSSIALTATGTFSDGSQRDITGEVDWRSSLFTTASVDGGIGSRVKNVIGGSPWLACPASASAP